MTRAPTRLGCCDFWVMMLSWVQAAISRQLGSAVVRSCAAWSGSTEKCFHHNTNHVPSYNAPLPQVLYAMGKTPIRARSASLRLLCIQTSVWSSNSISKVGAIPTTWNNLCCHSRKIIQPEYNKVLDAQLYTCLVSTVYSYKQFLHIQYFTYL